MAKKAKRSKEEDKEEDKPHASAAKVFSSDHDIFSESFKERLSQFASLTRQVLNLKASVEGSDLSDQISQRGKQMSEKVEEAAASILKEQLGELEDWIKAQQEKLSEDIVLINKAYQLNWKNLKETGSFSEDQIQDHLVEVKKRANEKQTVYDNYDALLIRCRNIYS